MGRLIVCFEASGIVREAFRAHGVDVWSCDLRPAEDGSPRHILGDALEALQSGDWAMMIAHPPCTYLSSSGLHWNYRRPERAAKTAERAVLGSRTYPGIARAMADAWARFLLEEL